MPGEEFLPRPPNPEDIIYVDDAENTVASESNQSDFTNNADNQSESVSTDQSQSDNTDQSDLNSGQSEKSDVKSDPSDQSDLKSDPTDQSESKDHLVTDEPIEKNLNPTDVTKDKEEDQS